MLDICSLCLVTDIQLQTIKEPLSDFHIELCNFELDGYAVCCLKCEHLLRKFYNFRNKCIKANIVLKKWKKQSKLKKIPIRKLHAIFSTISTSIGHSNDNNHAIFSYNANTEAGYSENNINNLFTTSIDTCNDDLINLKPGFVILDSTCPTFNKDAKFIKTTDLMSEENKNAESIADKTYVDTFSNKTVLESDSKKDKGIVGRVKSVNKSVCKKYSSDVNSNDNVDNKETFVRKTTVEKEIKDNEIEKCKVSEEVEATVKIGLDDRKEIGTLDSLEIGAGELNKEQNNVYDDDVLNEDDNNESDQNIDNDTLTSEVNSGDFNIGKHLKETIDTDLSDDEVLQKKRKKVISSDEQKDKKKKEVCKKRKSDDIGLDDSELSEVEPKQKKLRWKPVKHNLELTIEDVKRRLGNGDVRDKEGNVIDMDVIVNHLDKMSKHTYNKIKIYCAGKEPLSSQAIDFLAKTVERYSDQPQYSSIFITKHLTTDEEIMEEFRKRETYQNYVESEHKCTRCFRPFKYAKKLKYHIAEFHDPNNAHKCKYCDVSFSRAERLHAHWNTHRVLYQCKLCPLVTHYSLAVKAHFNFHNVTYPCKKCGTVLNSPPALSTHMNLHRSDHICPYCAKNLQSENRLHHHKMLKHSNEMNTEGPPSAKCELCNIQFISDEVYENHQKNRHNIPKKISADVNMSKKKKRSSNGTPIYTCRVCKHEVASMGALIWHFKSKHPNEEFDRHSMALRDPHKYLCHICGKGFPKLFNLKQHKNVHTDTRPYSCPKCPKAFHNKTYLTRHMKYHLPPTYQCPYCPMKFHSGCNLYNHKRTHIGDRRYACEICGKTFLHQGYVTEHVRGVHLQMPRTRKIRTKKTQLRTK